MHSISRAIIELHAIDHESRQADWLQSVHPNCKLLVTLTYLVVLVSFGKYHLAGTLLMGSYPIVLLLVGNISVNMLFRRLWIILMLVAFVGLPNIFFDNKPFMQIGNLIVTGGMISMITLFLKGVFAVTSAYLLMVTTPMDAICGALRQVHVPAILVTVLMLIYRYLIVFLKEVERMTDAYSLRAPGQRGVNFKAWGTMVGQLLLRSSDRAQTVYDSMLMRGFDGEFYLHQEKKVNSKDYFYLCGWILLFIIIRLL
ncbi:MAG: cobalt ECF transporter T component CbiQ [Bacteroidaceae bacterium]|nr:cobalt ECF transporter T component CbiQ [Bacteroidaceae bacterium]